MPYIPNKAKGVITYACPAVHQIILVKRAPYHQSEHDLHCWLILFNPGNINTQNITIWQTPWVWLSMFTLDNSNIASFTKVAYFEMGTRVNDNIHNIHSFFTDPTPSFNGGLVKPYT